ncbi:MAG: TerB N-terminal domain-containing protein [Desulfovibrio sp.]|jgi:tellurite resistance protein|nr:TerB N-terminal domain-containing protein [Desulfovibrio sp.]
MARRKSFTKRDAQAVAGLVALVVQLVVWAFTATFFILRWLFQTISGLLAKRATATAVAQEAAAVEPTFQFSPVAEPYRQPIPQSRAAAQPGQSRWIPANETVEVAGRIIPGGMLYLGSGLCGVGTDWKPEPALVDPKLSARLSDIWLGESRLPYWPSYSEASPEARGAYLQWLEGGRQAPEADTGYVFLFFYGLERRVFHDAERDPSLRSEFPAIEAEVRRLLDVYGGNHSFRSYASSLLDALSCFAAAAQETQAAAPTVVAGIFGLSAPLKIGLGRMVAEKRPIPADWAFAWLRSDPNIRLRTPAQRCPSEFQLLFSQAYAKRHGQGMVLSENKTRLKIVHRFASPSFHGTGGTASLHVDLPDVSVLSAPTKQLQAIADECMAALDSYSRLLGRSSDLENSADALAELPFAAWPEKAAAHLNSLHTEAQQAGQPLVRAFSDVFRTLPPWRQLTKARFSALLARLEEGSIGFEPDTRHGGALPETDAPVVLFHNDAGSGPITKHYHAAAFAMRIAASVAAADGVICDNERTLLATQAQNWHGLNAAERIRLTAHVAWLLEVRPGVSGLNKRLDGLSGAEKESLARFLALVALADGVLDAKEVRALEKLYKSLGLEAGVLYSTLHAAPTAGHGVTDAPVAVRPAQAASGFAIPPESSAPSAPASVCGFTLDMAKVAALQEESERAAAILEAVFASEEPAPSPESEAPDEPDDAQVQEETFLGLDAAHSSFWRVLSGRDSWTRAELEEIALERGLMLDGTLERLNEAALDAFDAPFCEGEDPVEINAEAKEGAVQ